MDAAIQKRVDQTLEKLLGNPHENRIRFEKLKGYRNPAIYTVHVTGNFKISMEIDGNRAILRRVAVHDVIDRTP